MKKLQIEQEDLLSRDQLIESIQEHYQFRIGRHDYTKTGTDDVYTIYPEEAEECLKLAGTGREGMALILAAMTKTNKFLQKEAKRNLQFYTQAEQVEKFFWFLKDEISLTVVKKDTKERSAHGERTEYCPVVC